MKKTLLLIPIFLTLFMFENIDAENDDIDLSNFNETKISKSISELKQLQDSMILDAPFKVNNNKGVYGLFIGEDSSRLVPGYIELFLRDSNGFLVGYLKIPNVIVVNNEIAINEIDSWNETDTIIYDGIKHKILQKAYDLNFDSDMTPGLSGLSGHPNGKTVFYIYNSHDQYITQPGDVLITIYSIFEPV